MRGHHHTGLCFGGHLLSGTARTAIQAMLTTRARLGGEDDGRNEEKKQKKSQKKNFKEICHFI
jgi:hypothetical protein